MLHQFVQNDNNQNLICYFFYYFAKNIAIILSLLYIYFIKHVIKRRAKPSKGASLSQRGDALMQNFMQEKILPWLWKRRFKARRVAAKKEAHDVKTNQA